MLTALSRHLPSAPFSQSLGRIHPTPAPRTGSSLSDALNTISRLLGSAEGVQYTSRLIARTAQALNPILPVNRIAMTFEPVDAFIAACRFTLDINYFAGTEFLKDLTKQAWLTVSTNFVFTISDIAATLEYLKVHNLANTAKLAASLGSISVFGAQPLQVLQHMAVGRFCAITSIIGYALMATDSAFRFYRGDHSVLTINGIARGLLEVAHRVLLALGGTFLTTTTGATLVTVMGIVAAGCAVNSVYQRQTRRS